MSEQEPGAPPAPPAPEPAPARKSRPTAALRRRKAASRGRAKVAATRPGAVLATAHANTRVVSEPEARYGPPPREEPPAAARPPRKGAKKGAARKAGEKPPLPPLDPLEAAQEEARHFKEGNHKLGLAVEALRTGLETITVAEWDRKLNRPVSPEDLRALAVAALDRYSGIVGQSWRAYRLTGATRAGGTGNKPVHEREMGEPPED